MIITPHLHPRHFWRRDGAAVPGRDGAGADRAVEDGRGHAVPVRRDLHAERRVPRHVASGHGRRELPVQARDAAARAVPRPARHHQQDAGAVGRLRASGRELGVPERRRPGCAARRHERRLRQDPVEEDRRPVRRRRRGRRHAAALDRAGHRRHGDGGRGVRRIPLHVLQHAVLAR